MKQRAFMLFSIIGLCGAATVAASSVYSDYQIKNRCQTFGVKLAGNPVLLREPSKSLRVVYAFDVSKADTKELIHILRPPLGSREAYNISATPAEHILTYATGRVGDLTTAAREVREMCLREAEDGFHLRTVRVLGNGIDLRMGPDAAELSLGRTGSIVVAPNA